MDKKRRYFFSLSALLLGGAIIIVLLLSLGSHPAYADSNILYVKPSGATSGSCDNWANACTFQYALSVTVSGDEIWVQAGIYKPGSNLTDTFTLKDGVSIYGGFTGSETSRNDRDPDANVTVLSGDIDGDDVTDANGVVTDTTNLVGSNNYHVVTSIGTSITTVLDGLVITAGWANGPNPGDKRGSGMYNVFSNATLKNVIISGNMAITNGGGMFNNNSNPTLTDVIFRGNFAKDNGGGMINNSSNPVITNAIFAANHTDNYGGGMYNTNSDPTIINAIFTGNRVALYGAGIYNIANSDPVLVNVTFYGNHAGQNGGGIFNYSNPSLTLANVIMWGNYSAGTGPGIYNLGTVPDISYSDIEGCGGSGTGWVSYCGSDNGNNLETNPLFVDADGADDIVGTLDDDLHLQSSSPCIDAGDNTAVPPDVIKDMDGEPRFMDVTSVTDTGNGTKPIVDIGAYEVSGVLWSYLPFVVR